MKEGSQLNANLHRSAYSMVLAGRVSRAGWPSAVLFATTLVACGMPAAAATPQITFEVTAFAVEGENPLSAEETNATLAPFLGAHEGLERLQSAGEALEQRLVESRYSFYRVVLPPQTLEAGVVRLAVVSFTLDKIDVVGNQHFSTENVLRSLPGLRGGESPDTQRIAREQAHASRHPSKQLQVRFSQSDTERAVDAQVRVQDQRPWSVFGLLDNTGTTESGRLRATVGAQYANLFDRDHSLTATYTRAPDDVDRIEQFGVNYLAPLYGIGGSLSLSFARSDSDSGTIAEVVDVTGAGQFLGVGYTHYLPDFGAYSQRVTLGIDDRKFENNVEFAGVDEGIDVRSRPVSIAYAVDREGERTRAGGYVSVARNIAKGSDNDSATYSMSRAGADANWWATRLGADADYRLASGAVLRTRLDAQVAFEPLISGEQFGAGGARSVRGYEEREVAGDSGVSASLEWWSKELYPGLRGIAFNDFGYVFRKQALVGEKRDNALWGAGLGARWTWREHVSASADLGMALRDAGDVDGGDLHLHFSVFARY